jgi:hypothetical protein
MTMTIHFNLILVIGLCLIPGSFIVAILAMFLARSQELGAIAAGAIPWTIMIVTGLIMIFIGIGMNIH